MPKKQVEYYDTDVYTPWTPDPSLPEGVMEKILAIDEYGNKTRLLKWPACETIGHTLEHDFWEETFILEGSLYDHLNQKNYLAGYYACRAPHMKHGPFTTSTGALLLEIHSGKEHCGK